MKLKKAQSELITTVLIILLVLAAIVIVWQVVMGVLNQGKKGVESQSECLGFSIAVTVINATTGNVSVIPNKDISAAKVYAGGVMLNETNEFMNAMSSYIMNPKQTTNLVGKEISTAGKIGNSWCDGMNKVTA